MFYGFPDLGDGIKAAFHHNGKIVAPDSLSSAVSTEEVSKISAVLQTHLSIDPVLNYTATCMYTNTPDENFIIDYHPEHNNIIIASPCSGHGFKFSSATGKMLCNMAIGKTLSIDLFPFRIDRFYNNL